MSDPVRPKQKGINQRVEPRYCLALIPMRVRLRELLALTVIQEIRRHDSVLVPEVLELRPLRNAITSLYQPNSFNGGHNVQGRK